MPSTVRERLSNRLLHGAIELGAEREQVLRSIRAATRDEHTYGQVLGNLWMAEGIEALLRWLAVRLRPRTALRRPGELS